MEIDFSYIKNLFSLDRDQLILEILSIKDKIHLAELDRKAELDRNDEFEKPLEEISDSETVEFRVDPQSYKILDRYTESDMLSQFSDRHNVIAILSDLPMEVGLYKLRVVVRTGSSSVLTKILKVWIVNKDHPLEATHLNLDHEHTH